MKRRAGDERGFALLLVFLMAAAVALMLYKAMPRAAFETERDKEQLLIDRGNQYKRAVQLYYTQFRRYPSSIDDLESTNDKRFLRRRYVDPFTGKDDWRIVHTNGMFLTDSKVQAPPAQQQPGQNGQPGNTLAQGPIPGSPGAGPGGFVTTGTTPGGAASSTTPNNPNAPPQVNSTVLARPSDRTLPGAQSFPGNNAPGANLPPITYTGNGPNTNFNSNDPNSFPPITLFPNGYNAPAQGGATQPNGLNQPQGLNRQPVNPISNQNGFINPNAQTTPVDQLPPITLPPANEPGQPNRPGAAQGFFPQGSQPGLPGANNPGLPGANNPGLPNQGFQPGPFNVPGGLTGANLNGVAQGLAQQGLTNPPANPQPAPNNIFNDPNNSSQPFQPGINGPPQNNPGFQNNFQQNPANLIPPGAGGPNMPGAGTANQSALGIINTLLTTPRPPPPGIGPGQPASNQQQTIGGGIAGVASKFEGPSIKSYGGQTEFSKWEFIFQLQQGAGLAGVPPQGGVPPGGTLPGIPPSPTVPATR